MTGGKFNNQVIIIICTSIVVSNYLEGIDLDNLNGLARGFQTRLVCDVLSSVTLLFLYLYRLFVLWKQTTNHVENNVNVWMESISFIIVLSMVGMANIRFYKFANGAVDTWQTVVQGLLSLFLIAVVSFAEFRVTRANRAG